MFREISCPNLPGTEVFPGMETFLAKTGTVGNQLGLLVKLFSQPLPLPLTPGSWRSGFDPYSFIFFQYGIKCSLLCLTFPTLKNELEGHMGASVT